jgi:uncharacterized membrane protein
MEEKKKMKGWILDVILVIGFFIGWFIVGLLISAIVVVIIYFLLRSSFDYTKTKKDKSINKNDTDEK